MLPSNVMLNVFKHMDVDSRVKARQICHLWKDLIESKTWPVSKVGFAMGFANEEQPQEVEYKNFFTLPTDRIRLITIPRHLYMDKKTIVSILKNANPRFLKIYGKK